MTTPTQAALDLMTHHGGVFAKGLAYLWLVADAENREVLEETDTGFGEVFAQYNISAERIANPSGMVWWARWHLPASFDAPEEIDDWFEIVDEEHIGDLRREGNYEFRSFPINYNPNK